MGPQLDASKLDQVAALPLGARVKVDPWDDHVELLKAKPVALSSAREKMPFEVTPFLLYLTRYQAPKAEGMWVYIRCESRLVAKKESKGENR